MQTGGLTKGLFTSVVIDESSDSATGSYHNERYMIEFRERNTKTHDNDDEDERRFV